MVDRRTTTGAPSPAAGRSARAPTRRTSSTGGPKGNRRPKKAKPPPTWRDYLVHNLRPGRSRGALVCRWVEMHCVHTNDRWTGKPFVLLLWQKMVIMGLFAVGADGLR